MSQEKIDQLIEKYNQGRLSPGEEQLLEQYIEQGLIPLEALQDLQPISKGLALLVNRDSEADMKAKFYDMLSEEKAKLRPAAEGFWNKLFAGSASFRWAYSLALIMLGFGAAMILQPRQNYDGKLSNLSDELSQMREMMLLTMLEKESTSERIKAVNLTHDMDHVSDRVANALLHTLNNDKNVNVRLVTLEALYPYANDPKVREGLIKSIQNQHSPLVQIALAETMVALQEKRSVKPLKELLNRDELPEEVKEQIQHSVEVLL